MTNALEITNLCKSFDGFTLDNINLTLPAGCIMGLIGENGAGKSTTIHLILGMLRKNSGTIKIFGKENTAELKNLKEDIGVVLDEIGYIECLTAKQLNNILKNTYKRWNEQTYFSYLKNFSLPENKIFKEFSRGMKMKLGIAAALSHDPKLLILDEATSGLDPVVRDEVVDLFNEFTRDETHAILISSHIVSDLEKLCDYIAFLHKGKLLLCDEKDVLLERYGMLHCTQEQFNALDRAAVKGKKKSPYGIEAVIERSKIPSGYSVSPVGIEELFIYMIKEAH